MKKDDYILTMFICVFIIVVSTTMSLVKAEENINVSIKLNVSFESQNYMKTSFELDEGGERVFNDYWVYREQIKNFYIINEPTEIKEYVHKFDVTEANNGRVIAYLVKNLEDNDFYDVFLMADGIIYPNVDSGYYFYNMLFLDQIDNLAGMDTSEVVSMRAMFSCAGKSSPIFELDLSEFNTSNVTDMRALFQMTGYSNPNFMLDLSNFDTSKVTLMDYMFNQVAFNSLVFELDVSSFDTSNVTNMTAMFTCVGHKNPKFTLDVSNFDTSKVTDMSYMFQQAGFSSKVFVLDVSNFDTSNVTDMKAMFADISKESEVFTLNLGDFDMSRVTNSDNMFHNVGLNSSLVDISLTISNPYMSSYVQMFFNAAYKEGGSIRVNYTEDTEELVDQILSQDRNISHVSKGNLIVDVDNLSIGDEIHISGEKFNVISQTDDTITMLAQYNLGTDNRQTSVQNSVNFANRDGWVYTPGPKEIDIQTWSTNPKAYVNEYVAYLQGETGDKTLNGNLITLTDLKALGCKILDDYSNKGEITCVDTLYKTWLVNGQHYWTRSAHSINSLYVWGVDADGALGVHYYRSIAGIRPTITISKETIRNF